MRARKNSWVFALWVLAGLLGAHAATAYKPTCRSSTGAIVQCSGTLDNTQAPTAIAASSLTGTVAQANGGLGVDASALSNGVVVKSGGVVSTATAPTMSGANITTATLPGSALTASSVATSKITGGTPNRIPYDNGTNASWTAAPSSSSSFLRGSTPPAFDLVNLNTDTAGVVPTAKGGTNLSSFTGGALLYASDTTTIGQLGPCSSSQFVGSNGTTPKCSALPTATTGSGSLSTAQYDITTTNTFEDIGLSVGLPSAGTYLVSAEVRTFCQTSGSPPPGYVTCKLYNSTDAADVTNSERFGAVDYTNNGSTDTLPIREVITIAAGKTIKVYCKTNSGPTFVNRGAASDANGRSRISYVKLSS